MKKQESPLKRRFHLGHTHGPMADSTVTASPLGWSQQWRWAWGPLLSLGTWCAGIWRLRHPPQLGIQATKPLMMPQYAEILLYVLMDKYTGRSFFDQDIGRSWGSLSSDRHRAASFWCCQAVAGFSSISSDQKAGWDGLHFRSRFAERHTESCHVPNLWLAGTSMFIPSLRLALRTLKNS